MSKACEERQDFTPVCILLSKFFIPRNHPNVVHRPQHDGNQIEDPRKQLDSLSTQAGSGSVTFSGQTDELSQILRKRWPEVTQLIAAWLILVLFLVACSPSHSSPAQFPRALTTAAQVPPGLEANSLSLTPTAYLPGVIPIIPVDTKTTLFTHPQEWFSIEIPVDWTAQISESQVTFLSPQADARMEVTIVNTGYSLEPASFQKLVNNREKRKALELSSYVELERGDGPEDHSLIIINEYYANEGPVRTVSYYLLKGVAVGIFDFSLDPLLLEAYQRLIDQILPTFQINAVLADEAPKYAFDLATRHSNGYSSVLIPPFWDYTKTEASTGIVETFISPDEKGVIQLLIYDDGEPVTRGLAGELALTLLRENYAKEITILEDRVLQDRREMLVWRSKDGSYQGNTSFTVHETGIFMLTLIWGNDPEGYLQSLLDKVWQSYMAENPPG